MSKFGIIMVAFRLSGTNWLLVCVDSNRTNPQKELSVFSQSLALFITLLNCLSYRSLHGSLFCFNQCDPGFNHLNIHRNFPS